MQKREKEIKIGALVLLILSSIFFINLISAASVTLAKTEYYPGETIQADISGVFSGGLSKDKIILCQGKIQQPVAISSDLVQMPDKFLFYAITSPSLLAGDYSLKIKSSSTPYSCLSGIIFSKPLKIIAPTDNPYLQVNPGFVTSLDNNNEIKIITLGFRGVQNINSKFLATSEANSFTLIDGVGENSYFSTNGLYGNIVSSITINDYTIPVYLSLPPAPENTTNQTENNNTNQTTEIILQEEIKFSPESMNLVVLNNTHYEINFSIINKGNKTIQNLIMSSNSNEIILDKENIGEISGYNSTIISMNFKITTPLSLSINLAYKNQSIYLPISINITKNQSEVDVETNVLDVNPASFDTRINFSQRYKFNFTIENNGNKTIEDIAISCEDENIKLDKTSITSIKPGKNTVIYFEINTDETIDSQIDISYDNETVILPVNFREYNEEEYNLDEKLFFYPEEMNGTFLLNKEYLIILMNIGEEDLENIVISCEDNNVKFTPQKIDSLKSHKKAYVNITINSAEDINTFLIAKWKNQEISLPINGIVTTNELEEEIDTEDNQQYPTCSGNGGITCKTGETCDGRLEADIRIPNCCYGLCQKKSSSTKWIIGIILLLVLGIAGFYFYSKYKNSKSSSSDEIMKNRAKDFEARMNPKEIHGGLSKI